MLILNRIILFLILSFVPALATAQEQPEDGPIYFIGFNLLKNDSPDHAAAFDAYYHHLTPIGVRYTMTGLAFDRLEKYQGDFDGDIVTIGTATSSAAFGAMFQDPEFLKIFPTLENALLDHTVIFTAAPFAEEALKNKADDLYLFAEWLSEDGAAMGDQLAAIDAELVSVSLDHGATLVSNVPAVAASHGFGEELEAVAAPSHIQIWHIPDGIALEADPRFSQLHEKRAKFIDRSLSMKLALKYR